MYEALMQTLRAFMGYGLLRNTLFAAMALIVIVLIAHSSISFRKKLAEANQKRGFKGILSDIINGLFKLSFLLVLIRLMMVALNYQSATFSREHGRITEKNRSAILMKWGMPHEQNEISVTQKRKRIWVTRQLLLKSNSSNKKDKVYPESFWKDQTPPVRAVNGKLPVVITEKETLKWVNVPQKSIISAEIDINVTNNPRRLGNANYAGYNDEWKLKYVIINKSKWETVANIWFYLPADTGFFDNIRVKVDGVDVLKDTKNIDEGLLLPLKLAPDEKKLVSIAYASRGLEHLRYIPARMSQSPHYRITMTLNGIPAEKLDYPIGSMPPIEKLSAMEGKNKYQLNWHLDNALTSYDIGIKLPDAEQPDYHYARLLREAPVALMLLLLILVITPLIYGEKIRLEIISLIAVVYCLHYTFMGRLADLIAGFWGPYIISSAVSIVLVFLFRFFASDSPKILRYIEIAAFAIMAVFFPLAVIDFDRTAFWMQLIYISVIIYVCVLFLTCRLYRKAQKNLNTKAKLNHCN
jgi:hypothetical protein